MTIAFFVVAAFFEIAGCFAFWSYFRLGRPAWTLALGVVSLILFAYALTRVDAAFAGPAYAVYGGIYIAASLVWLRAVEGVRPDRWDLTGATIAVGELPASQIALEAGVAHRSHMARAMRRVLGVTPTAIARRL